MPDMDLIQRYRLPVVYLYTIIDLRVLRVLHQNS